MARSASKGAQVDFGRIVLQTGDVLTAVTAAACDETRDRLYIAGKPPSGKPVLGIIDCLSLRLPRG